MKVEHGPGAGSTQGRRVEKEAALSHVRARLTSWDLLGVCKGHWPSQASAGARTKVRRGSPGRGNLAVRSQVIRGLCQGSRVAWTPPCCPGWAVLVIGNGWPAWGRQEETRRQRDMVTVNAGALSQLPDGAMFSWLHLVWRWLATYRRMVYIENPHCNLGVEMPVALRACADRKRRSLCPRGWCDDGFMLDSVCRGQGAGQLRALGGHSACLPWACVTGSQTQT